MNENLGGGPNLNQNANTGLNLQNGQAVNLGNPAGNQGMTVVQVVVNNLPPPTPTR